MLDWDYRTFGFTDDDLLWLDDYSYSSNPPETLVIECIGLFDSVHTVYRVRRVWNEDRTVAYYALDEALE